jgi:hypothetical protein
MLTKQHKSLSARKVFGPLTITVVFTCLLSAVAFAQSVGAGSFDSFQTNPERGPYMIGFYTGANEGLPDAQMHIVNPGSSGGYGSGNEDPNSTPHQGDLCANTYVFTSDEQMIACCSCKVSPNGMQGFSLATDLVNNPATGITPHAGAIKVISSRGGGHPGGLPDPPSSAAATSDDSGNACDAGSWYHPSGQLQTWITHVHPLGAAFGAADAVTEVPYLSAPLSDSEYEKVVQQCFALEAPAGKGGVGSGAGLCTCDPKKTI